MTSRTFDVLNVGLLTLAAGASVAVYDQLPEPMAIHFDVQGSPNGYTGRSVGAFALPALGLGLYLVLRIVDRRKSIPVFLTTALTALFVALHLAVLKFNLGSETIMATVLPFGLGLFMLVLGQTLPRTRQNGLVGFRTPWTMRSKENWYATHRFSGLLLTIGGAVSILAGAFVPIAATPITVVALMGASIAGTVYSYYFAQRNPTP